MPASEEPDELWSVRVTEAARRAAADIDPERDPQLRQLHADLVDLMKRLEADAERPA